MLLSEVIEGYYLACRVNNITQKTMTSYQSNVNNFLKVIGDMPVNELNPNHIRVFIAHEMGRKHPYTGNPLSTETIGKSYAVVRTFCRWLFDQGFTETCISDRTKPPKIEQNLPEALTKDEIVRIFEYIDIHCTFRDRVIWEFFLDTGCRLSEVAGLEINDVNLNEGWAKVFGKGRKEGIVPLGNKLCGDLHRYIVKYRQAPEDETALFVSNRVPHMGLTKGGLASLIKRVHKAVGITGKYGPHKLRHTMATQFISNGGDIAILRRILRHSDIKVTQRYINLVQHDVQSAHREYSPMDHLNR
jgi:integrase/recombinase XerD